MIHRFSVFVRRWRSPILFLILIAAGYGGFRRQEDNTAATQRLAEQNRQLTLQIAAINDAQQRALCESRVTTRADLKVLLLGMVDDFVPVGKPARFELERRINEALGPPPEDCR